MLASHTILFIVVAFTACNQQTANANNKHDYIMPKATPPLPSVPFPVNPGKKINLVGRMFGRMRVESYGGVKNEQSWWNCKCECGELLSISAGRLNSGVSRSCGCLKRDKCIERSTKHKLSFSPSYQPWHHMRARCRNKSDDGYHRYGGRGIKVCKRWYESLEDFCSDMGPRPNGTSIDRMDNNGHYSCGECDECKENGWIMNCRWGTYMEQANNTSRNVLIEYNGKIRTISQWARILGIEQTTLRGRIRSGWSKELALTKPLKGFNA